LASDRVAVDRTEQKRGGPDLIELNAPPDAAAHPEGERALIDKV